MTDVAVLFAIDSTGSMKWIHNELCRDISSILTRIEDEGVSVQFALAAFRDFPANQDTWIETVDFETEGVASMQERLRTLRAKGGGGNNGESSLASVVYGLRNLEWPDVKRRVIALFTDDGPHVPDYGVPSWESFHETLANNDVGQVHLFIRQDKQSKFDAVDYIDYDTFRYPLTEGDNEQLEASIRSFVKRSSDGLGGTGGVVRVRPTANPFDFADDIPTEVPEEPAESFDPEANPFDVE